MKLELLARHHAALIDGERSGEELVGPHRVELEERIPRCVPLSDRPHRVAGRRARRRLGSRPHAAAFASSSRIGAPRLHE